MRFLICIATTTLVAAATLCAQQKLGLNLVMNPNPSPYLSAWQTKRETVLITVNNPTNQSFNVKLVAQLVNVDAGVKPVAHTNVEDMPAFTVAPASTTVKDAEYIVPYEAVSFEQGVDAKAVQTGMVPPGRYKLCVWLVNSNNPSENVSNQSCKDFTLTKHLPPILYAPANQQQLTLDQLRSAVFRWSKESPPISESQTQFVVVEYRDGQPLWQALAANPPVFQTVVEGGLTQLQWLPDVMLPERQYVWSVRVADFDDKGLTEPEWAEPFLFTVAPETSTLNCSNAELNLETQRTEGNNNQINVQAYATTNVDPRCIKSITWSVNKLSDATSTAATTRTAFVAAATTDRVDADVRSAMSFTSELPKDQQFEVVCRLTLLSPSAGEDITKSTFVEKTANVVAFSTVGGNNRNPCTITILSPSGNCDGVVETESPATSINVTVNVSGPLSEFEIIIRENPCGTYSPPYEPSIPTPSEGPTTKTPSGGSTTTPSGPITQDKYVEKHRKKVENPTQGANTTSVPIAEYIIPGGAYIIEAVAVCPNPDGTFSTVASEPVCDRYRPMATTTTTERDRPPVPVPIPHCPDTTVGRACGPSFHSEPATPIEATIELESPDNYPYPRAVPLRAKAIDFDYAVFECTGCGGVGKEYRPIRDQADIVAWELKGKGSLNTPFNGNAIEDLDKEIDALLARLAAIKDSLSLLNSQRTKAVDKFKKDLEAAKKLLAKKEDERKATADRLKDVVKRLDSTKEDIDSLRSRLDSLSSIAKKWRDSARINQDSVVRYDSLLTNPPSATEISLLKDVASTKSEFETADNKLNVLIKTIAKESAELQKTIRKTDSLLTIAQAAYKSIQESVGKLTRSVADLQHVAYATDELKKYRSSRRELQTQHSTFAALYSEATGQATLVARISKILTDAHNALLSTVALERTAAKKTVDSLSAIVKASLIAPCSPVADSARKAGCKSLAVELALSVDKFNADFKACIITGQKLSPAIETSILKARGELTSKEPSVQAAASGVNLAAANHKAAVEEYKSKMTARDKERVEATKLAEAAKNKNAQAQRDYQNEKGQRDSVFRVNQPKFLVSRATFSQRRDSSYSIIDSISLLFASTRDDSISTAAAFRELLADTSSLSDSIRVLQTEINELKAFTKLTEADIAKPFDIAIARLKSDSAEIEKKLKDKKKEREEISKGIKSAADEMVYYIPPPLEEIMKNKARFQELKDSLAAAETRLKIALSAKEAVQGQLARLLEGIAGDLVDIKQQQFSIKQAEDEGSEVDKDLADKKNKISSETKKEYDKIDADIKTAQAEESSADAKFIDAVKEVKSLQTELEQREKDLNSAQEKLHAAREKLKKVVEERASKAADVQATGTSTSSAGDALNGDRKDLRAAQRNQRKGKDQTKRGMAREDASMEVAGRAATSSAESAIKSKENSIDVKKSSIVQLSKQLGVQFDELVKKDTAVAKALKEFAEADDDAGVKEVARRFTYFKLERAQQKIEYWRRIRDLAESRKEENEQRLDDMPKPDEAVGEDEDVKAGKERKAELEETIEKANKEIEASKKSIENALAEKKTIVEKADKEIEDATKNLEAANKNLHDFLADEFKTVTHADTLVIKVKDRVVDAFRAGDPLKTVECIIRYSGSRTPVMMCPDIVGAAPPPKKEPGPCIPSIGLESAAGVTGVMPRIFRQEPRTIALVYKNGKPLWKEWPVIEESKTLAKDVVTLLGPASDGDVFVIGCKPQVYACKTGPPLTPGVVDLASRTWIKHDGTYRHILERSPYVLWEPDKVPQGECNNKQKVEAEYRANEIAPDPTDKQKSEFPVDPGVLIEIPDSLVGWPKKIDTVVARVVTGDHKGLDGESIEVTVKLVEGKSEDWGLDGTSKKASRKTDGDGYIKIPFNYGDGFAKFEFDVKWHRPDTCKKEKFTAISPLYLKFHRLGNAPPTLAWNSAKEVWEGAGVEGVSKKMPDITEDENPYEKKIHGIAGFLDEKRNFVNDELMKFKPVSPDFEIDPKEVKTSLFGIARTEVQDEIKEGKISLNAACEDSLKPVCKPPDTTRTYDPKGENKFKIGSPDDLFVVEMEEGFDPSDVVSGNGKLKIDSPNEFLQSLIDLPLVVEGVELDKSLVASKGQVSYKTGGITAHIGAFTIEISSIGIIAQTAATLEGSVGHKSLENPVGFSAALGAEGEFIGEITNLPSVSFADFKLRDGASVTIDFHSTLPEKTPLGPAFQGIIIGKAELEFPKAFRVRETDAPTVLSASDLAIGDGGVTGTISIEGGPIKMSYAKYALTVTKLSLTFEANKVKGAEIKGAFTMDKPLTGTIEGTISVDAENWKAAFSTESSITIPRWKAAVAILPGTQLVYNVKEDVGEFTLKSRITSERFGTIDIEKLFISSKGKFEVKGGVKKDIDIKILSGMDLHLTGVSIAASNDEFELQIDGKIGIPGIGLNSLEGTLIVRPGPEVDVKIKGGDVTISKGPFELKGKFSYKENEFYAKLSVEIKNVLKGIEGEIFVGTQPTDVGDTYTYWYVGLTVTTVIPLGQSGLAITEIGGGIGWNCVPPIGSEKPSPENFNSISLRASVGIGNSVPPVGKIFNSRFTMIYAPGSITLAGEAWLLDQQKNIVGSGKLTVAWDPATKVYGDVQARVALPDNDGKIVLIRGKVDFLFDAKEFKIESEFLDASVLSFLNANAQFKVTKKEGYLKGRVWYELEKSADIIVATLAAELAMDATLDLAYSTSPSISLTGAIAFTGSAKLTASSGPFSWDLASASIKCTATVATSASKFKVTGTVKAYASVLGFKGNVDYDVGFEV